MPKRQRNPRQRPGEYIPWGKPEEVVIEHVEAEKVADGRVIEARYVERFKGKSTDSRTAHDTSIVPKFESNGALHHPNGCQGQEGIAITWIRDGRTWCRADYRLRYGEDPDQAAYRPPTRRYERPPEPPFIPKVKDSPGGKFLSL